MATFCSVDSEDSLRLLVTTSFIDPFTPLIVETVFFGSFTSLILLSTYVLLRKGFKSRANAIILFLTIVMYIAAAIHWGENIQVLDISFWSGPSQALWFSFNIITGGDGESGIQFAAGITELINIIISDSIVVWRAWLLWGRSRAVLFLSALLVVTTLSIGIANLVLTKGLSASGTIGDTVRFSANGPGAATGLVVTVMSLVTNLWASGLISYKAWFHRRRIRAHLNLGTRTTRVEQTLGLLVESGVIYSLIWTLLLICNLLPKVIGDELNSIVTQSIVQIAGMYPTMLVTLVSLQTTLVERLNMSEMPTLPQMQFAGSGSRSGGGSGFQRSVQVSLPTAQPDADIYPQSPAWQAKSREYAQDQIPRV